MILATNNEAQTTSEFIASFNAAIDARIAYESDKNAANDSIKSKLNAIRKSVAHDTIASVMIACSYSVDSINTQERVSNRRNVYTLEKEANAARYVAKVASLNHYTLAIFKTALALEAASFVLTHASARAACSAGVKCNVAAQERIVKTTRYTKHTDASTASTQSSSSINALQALHVFIESRNEANEITYTIDRESFATQQIAARLEVSLAVATVETQAQ